MLPDLDPLHVDWPRLVDICERRGIPVSRVDDHGHIHLIRTTRQLLTDWEQ